MNKYEIAVIGGGAAGIAAAIQAGRNGKKTVILEGNDRIGKKILTTGNGRCNYTNMDIQPEYYNQSEFVKTCLKFNMTDDIITFFKTLGITPRVEEEGKIFPMSGQAGSVVTALLSGLERAGVDIITSFKAAEIKKVNKGFIIKSRKGDEISAKLIIQACGGMAMPSTGSDGGGYKLCKSMGHTTIKTLPARTKLIIKAPFLQQTKGVKIEGDITLYIDGKKAETKTGDVLFTEFGMSGPPVLDLSGTASRALDKGKSADIVVDLLSGLSYTDTVEDIKNRRVNLSGQTISSALNGLLNKRLIMPMIKMAGIDIHTDIANLTDAQVMKLAGVLKKLTLKVGGVKGWGDAQVTMGGINTYEINPETMESKIIKGLYFAGEIIDVDGICGGYNLHFAWASGITAAENASKELQC